MRERRKVSFIFFIIFFLTWVTSATEVYGKKPYISAQSAILMEEESTRVLYEKQAHKPMRIASITKIMTAILAIESGKMNDVVTVSKEATLAEGSSIYLEEGEKIKLRDLVYGLMLRSGNDAAVAISEYVGGSQEGFVYLMNKRANEIGMKHTSFKNPHGLDDHEDHYSTAYDMALLTSYAMKNKEYRKIAGTKKYRSKRIGSSAYRIWGNKNKLLTGFYKYSTGGKTGYTKRAKRTLVSTAKKGGMNLICVTLNAPDDWNDHMYLFEWGYRKFAMEPIVKRGEIDDDLIKEDFYKDRLYVNRSFYYPIAKNERDKVKTELNVYQVRKEKWKKEGVPNPIGNIHIYFDDEYIKTIPVWLKESGELDD